MPESRLRPCGGTPVPAEGAGGSCAHAESLATWTPHTGCGVTCPDMRVSALMRHLMCFRAKFRKYPRRQWENNLTSKGILSRKKLVHRAVRQTNAGVCDRLLSILCITIFTQLQMQQEGRGGSGEIAPRAWALKQNPKEEDASRGPGPYPSGLAVARAPMPINWIRPPGRPEEAV